MENNAGKKTTVKKRITIFSVIMIVFMVFIAGLGLLTTENINSMRKDRYNNYAMSEYYLSEAFSNFCNVKVRVRNILFLYHDDAEKLQTQKAMIDDYMATEREYMKLFEERMVNLSPEIQGNYQDVIDAIDEYYEWTDKNIAMAESGQVDEAAQDLMDNGTVIADDAEAELAELISMLQEESEANNTDVERQLIIGIILEIVAIVAAVVIAVLYSIRIIKVITVPVNMLSEAAKRMAVGDIDVHCEKIADDDLGVMTENFSAMIDSIKEQAEVAEQIADGDMTVRIKPRSDKDVLGMALNKLAEDQDKMLSIVKESTMQVTIGAEQVASASQMLAQGSTEQASALQEVTASINEIAKNTKENATNATTANNLVNSVRDMAVDGKAHMQSMVGAMDEISTSSETISKIIKTIDDISFQTNILALNAAVEAARAGVHGKGFAVVAEEVRNLASKSASAAKETADMIEDSIRKVDNGQKLADVTAEALEKIVDSIHDVTELVAGIAEASNEQATAVSQIDQAIGQVSIVVQTNSATSEECAATSEELSNQAGGLRDQMTGYKLSGAEGSSPVRESRKESVAQKNNNEQIISLDGEFGKY